MLNFQKTKLRLLTACFFLALAVPSWCVLPSAGVDRSVLSLDQPAKVQLPDARQLQAVEALKQERPEASINWDPSVGTPSQIGAKMLGAQSLSADKSVRSKAVNQGSYAQRAIAVMDNLAPLFRIKDAASDFQAPKADETDNLGFRHQRLEQVYRGRPVVGGNITVHFDSAGAPYRVDGRYIPDVSVATEPGITAQAATDVARNDFAARGFSSPAVRVLEQPELVIYARGTGPVLAYQLVLQDTPANAWRYWVNAANGEIVASENRVCHIAPPTSAGGIAAPLSGNVLAGEGGGIKSFGGWSENSVYYMYSPTNFYFVYNNAGTTADAPSSPAFTADRISVSGVSPAAVYTDANTYAYRSNSLWGSTDPVEVSIAANMQATFGYYKSVHGRNGYDDAGTVVAAVAHYYLDYANAFWDGVAMYFGDGDGVIANPLAVTDVCAHELTHAVTETTANLDYQDESGALNESFSDIFGALVEFNAQLDGRSSYPAVTAGTGDWLCGEDCWLDGTALRDFRNPSSTVTLAAGYQQPSKYKGSYWQDYNTQPWDNGGVHQNSGIQNFFFYLLCEGGTGSNGGISYNFTGIGIENAGQVAYRTLTVYCTPSTDYKQVQNAWVSAAQDLDPSWVPAVKAAWRAVGIGITSSLSVKAQAGFPVAPYRITAPDSPSSYAASGLPAGLTLNTTSGIISGTPTAIGEFDVEVSATTGGVTFTDTLHFSILDPSAPVVRIDSPIAGAKFPPGRPFKVQVTATDLNDALQPGLISRVDLYVDGALVETDSTAPYEFFYTPSALGNPVLTAIATDTDAKTGESDPVNLEIGYLLPGELDYSFIPPGANDHVQALAADPQGRFYIGGRFTQLFASNSSSVVTNAAPRVARILPDGSIDPLFYVGSGPNDQVRALLHVPQDKGIYVGGNFSTWGTNNTGQPLTNRGLVRLCVGQTNATGSPIVDGSIDSGFAPVIEGPNASVPPYIRAILRQDDGKIVVGGSFSKVNGTSRVNLARLNPDGSLDTTFAPDPTGAVHCLAATPEGKIVAGGAFTQIAGQTSYRIARLNRDGTRDTNFNTGTGVSAGFDGAVNAVAITPDGEIVVGGSFTRYNGRSFYNNMAKLLPTGEVDPKFNFTPGLNGVVNDLHLRPTGQILVSGLFTQVANNVLGITTTDVGRVVQLLNGGTDNGTIDALFNPGGSGADSSVLDSITLPNGDILLAGAFTHFNGAPKARLAVVAGFDQSLPAVVSASSLNIDAGGDLDFSFQAAGPGPFTFSSTGVLPRGVTFDPATGKLSGVPLDPGVYEFQIVATSTQGSSLPVRFVLGVNDTKVTYAQWKKAWFSETERTNNAVAGPDAVRNGAGLNNLLVYALGGGNPSAAGVSLCPVVRPEVSGGQSYLTLTADKYRGAIATNLVEFSTDLVNWRSSSPADVVVLSETATQLKVRAAVPVAGSPKQYLHLKVLAP